MNPSSLHTLVVNVKNLMVITKQTSSEVAKKSGLSKRMIDYLIKDERGISVDSIDMLAKAFDLKGWHLMIAGLNHEAAKSGLMDKLVTNFNKCDKVTQEYLAHTAQKDAKSSDQSIERRNPSPN